jgi:manganese efflux pump family protein
VKKIWDRLKLKWGVESDKRMAVIFVVFAITGTVTLIVRKTVFQVFHIDIDNIALGIIVKWLSIYLIYQVMLLIIGSICGEKKFFWWFIRKMNLRIIGKKA